MSLKKYKLQNNPFIVPTEDGKSIKIKRKTRVQYSNPFNETCEYIAICTPAFSLNLVNRDE